MDETHKDDGIPQRIDKLIILTAGHDGHLIKKAIQQALGDQIDIIGGTVYDSGLAAIGAARFALDETQKQVWTKYQTSKVLSNASPMGLLSRDKLFDDLQEPGRPLTNDSDLRSCIYERYLHFGGSRYERELPDMLPRSDCCVFTHADIAPRNVMTDEQNTVTGILDWEWVGWYPDYWEYAQIMRPAFEGDFKVWIDGI
ncbi:hypothetical protein IFM61392_02661 [Aspergillus lentulus]|uniref:Aminoglycoside phosphotransferase domain-containing protein n=1 Tax=Aspergillus lentulus TaxID=293939 RepID=A0AAN5YM34_ASPLE|nr:hypothetical protein CNMCM8927_008004 [Aspergillus lentulus]GFF72131.1 hypothetical protein IFM60648_03607 [Aspergillus lentulus]GFF93469.1 hypothetical protein IFM47457_09545 [Aspergillus lentulus]GFG03157.1 hypothetical protein IFM61392_02661 [Aspergillus lentulus]